MKRGVIIIIALVALLAAGCSLYKAQPLASSAAEDKAAMQTEANAVNIEGFAFNPQEIRIKAGDSVSWANLDSAPHTVKFGAFESDRMDKDGKYSRAFTEPGEYAYICGIHPKMKGKVIVE